MERQAGPYTTKASTIWLGSIHEDAFGLVISRSGGEEKSLQFRIDQISPYGRDDRKSALYKGLKG